METTERKRWRLDELQRRVRDTLPGIYLERAWRGGGSWTVRGYEIQLTDRGVVIGRSDNAARYPAYFCVNLRQAAAILDEIAQGRYRK